MSDLIRCKLSDSMSAWYDDGNITLFDTQAYRPKRITAITSSEMTKLITLYTDGCCPVCLKEIAQNDVVCDGCFERAKSVFRGG